MDLRKALNRISFGVRQDELKALETKGWIDWVDQQLSIQKDDACNKKVKSITYSLEKKKRGRTSEDNYQLDRYFLSAQELWNAGKANNDVPKEDIRRPAGEVALVTWTKAIHSKNQLFEIMTEFWHNHFNVSVEMQDEVALLFPVYDREVIRKHAFGNFRQFLEAVAKSPCMLYYLDNAYSKASPANENYARELFELHTLGAPHYYNHLYNDWKQVPGAENATAEGYIDEDVYEAARAFTGWTVADGRDRHQVSFPSTGEFYYYDQWHDHYQKRILGVEFKSHQDAMADGLKVLDLVARHPGTARYVCTKLCRWLVADNPPEAVIDEAVYVWTKNLEADDQIAQVIRAILLSDAFAENLNTKVKRPNHLVISLIRQLELDVTPSIEWIWALKQMGYRQFTWPTPTGHPDDANYWLNTDMMLKRWNVVPLALFLNVERTGDLTFSEETLQLENTKLDGALDHWSEKLLGRKVDDEIRAKIHDTFYQKMERARDVDLSFIAERNAKGLEFKLIQLVSMLALSPDFQKR